MNSKSISLVVVAVIALIVLIAGSPFYVVEEYNQAIITMFGKPVGEPVADAGLHLKLPFLHKVTYFEKRILEWDGDATQIPTKDKKYIWVDTTARWKISDPLKFYQSVFDERGAHARLDDIVDATVRDLVTYYDLIELVRSSNRVLEADQQMTEAEGAVVFEKISNGREFLRKEIFDRAKKVTPQYGVELVDVQIKRVKYVQEVERKVYERMISERKRAAEELRSMGRGKKAEIEGTTQKELKKILSEAYRDSEKIKGEADKQATDIYAAAYGADPEFFAFLKTLDAYLTSANKDTTMIISTNSDYFEYMKSHK